LPVLIDTLAGVDCLVERVLDGYQAHFIAASGIIFTPLCGVTATYYHLCAFRVFPANIKHAVEGIHLPPAPDSWLYRGPRLPKQPVLVWWALFCAEVIDWDE
jgi:uncharacterized membrane protein